MTSSGHLDITVIYADDGRVSPQVRKTTRTAPAMSGSRMAGLLALLMSAAWLFVVWFPLDTYLDACLMRKSPFMPEGVDLMNVLFGGPPPAEYAVQTMPEADTAGAAADAPVGPATDPDASSYRSPGRTTQPPSITGYESAVVRRYWPHVVGAWVGLTTLAGLSLALAGGSGAAQWMAGPQTTRPAAMIAALAVLVAAFIAFKHWPGGGQVPRITPNLQYTLAAAFTLGAAALCICVPKQATGLLFVGALALFSAVFLIVWNRYGVGVPEIAQRVGALAGMLVASLLGAALAGRRRSIHNLALGLVVLAGLGTLAGLAYGHRVGGFVDFAPSAQTYSKAAGLHALALVPLVWGRLAAR